jgi:hypothetical protein
MTMMKKLLTPTVLILCPMLSFAGFAPQNIAPAADDSGISARESGISNRAQVIKRLEKVGYSREEATNRVDQMTDDEINYFAAHPESIKRSGFIILASLIGSSVYTTINNAKKKKEAYTTHLNGKIAEARSEIGAIDNKKTRESVLLAVEQDSAKKAERQATIDGYDKEIQAKQDNIKALENEIQLVNTGKQKVPKDFRAPKKGETSTTKSELGK